MLITGKWSNYTIWQRKVQNVALLADMDFQNYCEDTMQILEEILLILFLTPESCLQNFKVLYACFYYLGHKSIKIYNIFMKTFYTCKDIYLFRLIRKLRHWNWIVKARACRKYFEVYDFNCTFNWCFFMIKIVCNGKISGTTFFIN